MSIEQNKIPVFLTTENQKAYLAKTTAKIFIKLFIWLVLLALAIVIAVLTQNGWAIFGAVVVMIAGAGMFMTKGGQKATVGKDSYKGICTDMKRMSEALPEIIQYFGVPNTSFIIPLPSDTCSKLVSRELPPEIDSTGLYSQNDFLSLVMRAYHKAAEMYGYTKHAESLNRIQLQRYVDVFEFSMAQKIIWRAIVNIEQCLGMEINEILKEQLNNFYTICEKNDANLYYFNNYNNEYYIDINLFENELKRICAVLNLDYSSTGLGQYSARHSTWFGWGSQSAINTAIGLSIFSRLNAAHKESMFKKASAFHSFNNIIYYFNNKYHAALPEWQAFVEIHPLEKISIS